MSAELTTILSVILGFLLGILGQFLSSFRKEKKDEKAFTGIDEMITKEYINPYHTLSDSYFDGVDSVSKDDLINSLLKSCERLEYLKEKEIYFWKSDNQFKMIRLIEFTKIYFQQSIEIFKDYSFQTPYATQEDYDKEKEIYRENINKLKEKYRGKKEKYLNLETDSI